MLAEHKYVFLSGAMKPIISSMHFVYVIQSQKDNTYYIGYTQDLVARIKAHNQGKSTYTRARRPWEAVYIEQFSDMREAKERELALKSKKNMRRYLEMIGSPAPARVRD